jgi:hypothetical protein
MSTKVSGTTAGGQFFAAGAAPKDITLANEAAWGSLAAEDNNTTDGAPVVPTEGAEPLPSAVCVAACGVVTSSLSYPSALSLSLARSLCPSRSAGATAPVEGVVDGTVAAAPGDVAPPAAAEAEAGASGDAPADDAGGKVRHPPSLSLLLERVAHDYRNPGLRTCAVGGLLHGSLRRYTARVPPSAALWSSFHAGGAFPLRLSLLSG